MFSFQNTVFQIGHVPLGSEKRDANYRELYARMEARMRPLGAESIGLTDFAQIADYSDEFPGLEVRTTTHTAVLHENIAYVCGENGIYTDFSFPKFPGEYGLLMSVWRGLRKFLETDAEHVLWLEDDIIAYDTFDTSFDVMGSAADFEFDFLVLGTLPHQMGGYDYAKELTGNPDHLSIGNPVFCKSYQVGWAGAVLISRRGAEKTLRYFEEYGLTYPWDWFLLNVRSEASPVPWFDTFAAQPWVVRMFDMNWEAESASTIDLSRGR